MQGALAGSLITAFGNGAFGADPRTSRPQPGDLFVFVSGEKAGKIVMAADLPVGGRPVFAWPMEPASQTVRDGSRLNQVLLIRLDPEELSEETRARAANGVAAYSAVCTHQGCPVSAWKAPTRTLFCNCHSSEFDPKDNARVVNGPAPWRLAMLPLAIDGDVLVATGGFTGRVGFQKA